MQQPDHLVAFGVSSPKKDIPCWYDYPINHMTLDPDVTLGKMYETICISRSFDAIDYELCFLKYIKLGVLASGFRTSTVKHIDFTHTGWSLQIGLALCIIFDQY
jgi:hypothetical protein